MTITILLKFEYVIGVRPKLCFMNFVEATSSDS